MSITNQDASGTEEGKTKFGLPIDNGFSRAASEEQIERAAASLRKHNIAVEIVDTVADARRYVNSILPKDQTILTAASETLRLSGLDDDINNSGNYKSIRPQLLKLDPQTQMTERRRLSAAPDVIVGSVHAVTEDGRLVVASAGGSQLGSYSAGAAKAIYVVGSQKIVPDLDTAMRRIQLYSYPLEDIRAREKYGRPTVVAKILIINADYSPNRSTVVLIREPIGF